MLRDANRLRRLLLEAEAAEGPLCVLELTDIAHAELLHEAGLVERHNDSTLRQRRILIDRITWKGYELLDAIRDEASWAALVGAVGATAPFDVIEAVAKEMATQQMREAMTK